MLGTVATELSIPEICKGLKTNESSKQIENFRKFKSITNSAIEWDISK